MDDSCINWLDIAFDIHTIAHVVKVSRMITDTFCVLFIKLCNSTAEAEANGCLMQYQKSM